jgi:hypothetical protein
MYTAYATLAFQRVQTHPQVNKYAFSGGGATAEEQRKNGANLEVRVLAHYIQQLCFEMYQMLLCHCFSLDLMCLTHTAHACFVV